MKKLLAILFLSGCTHLQVQLDPEIPQTEIGSLVTSVAEKEDVDVLVFHRLVRVSSNYNTYATSKTGIGLAGISLTKARLAGYNGDGIGLFNAETNLTYSARYFRGVTGGNYNDCVSLSRYQNLNEKDCTSFGKSLLTSQ